MEELMDQAEKMEEEEALDKAGAGWQEPWTRQKLENASTDVDEME